MPHPERDKTARGGSVAWLVLVASGALSILKALFLALIIGGAIGLQVLNWGANLEGPKRDDRPRPPVRWS